VERDEKELEKNEKCILETEFHHRSFSTLKIHASISY
jgi:hypothetical protein